MQKFMSIELFRKWIDSKLSNFQSIQGGVLKIFDSKGCIASDTGLIGELDDGTVVVTHLVQDDSTCTEIFSYLQL